MCENGKQVDYLCFSCGWIWLFPSCHSESDAIMVLDSWLWMILCKRKIVFVWLEILQSCSRVIVHESCKLPSDKFLLSTSRSIPDSAFQSLVCLQIAAGWLRVLFLTTLIKKLREVPPGNNPVFKDHLTRDILHECKSCALFWYRFSLVNFFIKKALTVLLLESWLKNLSEESFLFSKMDAFTVTFEKCRTAWHWL